MSESLWNIWEREVTGVSDYVVVPDFLSPEECDVISSIHDAEIESGREGWGPVAGGDEYYPGVPGQEVNFEFRKVKAAWVPGTRGEIYDLVYQRGAAINDEHFGFDIDAVQDLQLCRYGVGEHFCPHYDSFVTAPTTEFRKMTISVLLNEPEDFEGSIDLYLGEAPIRIKHARRGMAVAFPSWVLHAVDPVDKGERRVMVAWYVGRKYT